MPNGIERDVWLRTQFQRLISTHPGYGYRPLQAELAAQGGPPVNHKRLRRVLWTYVLLLPRCLPKETPHPVPPSLLPLAAWIHRVTGRRVAPLAAFSTDFTEWVYAQGRGKTKRRVLVGIASDWAGGWAVGQSTHHPLALHRLSVLYTQRVGLGLDPGGVIIHHDQDPVYTSHEGLHQVLTVHRARVSCAEHGARDHPWIESFWGRFKT